jgi:flagellar biosynthesis chaperone FliJ
VSVFRFELETVLEQRRLEERRRMKAVGELERERLALEERVREAQRSITDGREALRERLGGVPVPSDVRADETAHPRAAGRGVRVDVRSVRLQLNAALHAEVSLRRLATEMAGLQRRTEAALRDLMQAVIARKAVETLRERRYRAWRAEQSRRELAEQDDLVVMRRGDEPATDRVEDITGGGSVRDTPATMVSALIRSES